MVITSNLKRRPAPTGYQVPRPSLNAASGDGNKALTAILALPLHPSG